MRHNMSMPCCSDFSCITPKTLPSTQIRHWQASYIDLLPKLHSTPPTSLDNQLLHPSLASLPKRGSFFLYAQYSPLDYPKLNEIHFPEWFFRQGACLGALVVVARGFGFKSLCIPLPHLHSTSPPCILLCSICISICKMWLHERECVR